MWKTCIESINVLILSALTLSGGGVVVQENVGFVAHEILQDMYLV